MSRLLFPAIAAFCILASPAYAHFGLLIPDREIVSKDETVINESYFAANRSHKGFIQNILRALSAAAAHAWLTTLTLSQH